jgi:hypothetical protein
MPGPAADPGQPARRWLARGYGVYVIVASIIIAFLTWLALHMLAPVAADRSGSGEIPPFVLWCVAARGWMPLLSLPALLCGLALLRLRRRSLPFIVLGTAALLLPLAITLYCFIMLLAQLYTYQPL